VPSDVDCWKRSELVSGSHKPLEVAFHIKKMAVKIEGVFIEAQLDPDHGGAAVSAVSAANQVSFLY